MKIPISIMTSVVLICFAFFIGINYSAAALTTRQARQFHQEMIDEIEASHHNPDVIADCKNKANHAGYSLIVSDDSFYEGLQKYKVSLIYHQKVSILGISNNQTLDGYAQ